MNDVLSKKTNQQGFSLMEMLVTISVMVTLMTVTTISFLSSEKNEILRLSARRIGDALQQIESYAQSGPKEEYQTAQSYGVHIGTAPPQKIFIFADVNTPLLDGKPVIGRWDGDAADARGKKDVLIGEARGIEAATGTGTIALDSITVAYTLNDALAVNAACAKDAVGKCVKDISGYYISTVSSIDVAAVPPAVRFIVSGGADFPSHISGITVRKVIFDVKQKNADKHKLVTLNPLSGRIDVEY